MKKFLIQTIFLLVIIAAGLYYAFPWSSATLIPLEATPTPQPPKLQQLKISDSTITIEIADTPALRSLGLGGRDSLPADRGMLFLFDKPGRYQFWMKGMKIPLDLIFIKNAKVVDLLQNVPNPSPDQADSSLPIYQPTTDIDMVLEVNSGFVSSHSIKIGDGVYVIKNNQ